MLAVIEESFKLSVWCREIIDGLRQTARKKRISLNVSTDIGSIGESEDSSVILVGAETEWLCRAVRQAKKHGKHPIILSNQYESSPENGVSRVTEDIFGSVREILSLFSAKGIESVALYAVNPDSASDNFKKEAFLSFKGQSEDVFHNEGSLSECFERFYERHKLKSYGGIVCANDFAAISLIRHLKERGEDLGSIQIISYSDTVISKCVSPAVSTVRANYKNFGQLAFMIYDCITKNGAINGMHVFCKWDIIHRETSRSGEKTERAEVIPKAQTAKSFYGDSELMEMMRIEELLNESDDLDREIITAVLSGKKTSEIAEACFLTESALKYRIGKMKELCQVESRSKLREFLLKYIIIVSNKFDNA